MVKLVISDLIEDRELDRAAMGHITGGSRRRVWRKDAKKNWLEAKDQDVPQGPLAAAIKASLGE